MSFDLVLFGGTGDLTWRKLMPALFQAFKHGTLARGWHASSVWAATTSPTTITAA
jgi:glucose-6-phosphate 1-dehydrogenase